MVSDGSAERLQEDMAEEDGDEVFGPSHAVHSITRRSQPRRNNKKKQNRRGEQVTPSTSDDFAMHSAQEESWKAEQAVDSQEESWQAGDDEIDDMMAQLEEARRRTAEARSKMHARRTGGCGDANPTTFHDTAGVAAVAPYRVSFAPAPASPVGSDGGLTSQSVAANGKSQRHREGGMRTKAGSYGQPGAQRREKTASKVVLIQNIVPASVNLRDSHAFEEVLEALMKAGSLCHAKVCEVLLPRASKDDGERGGFLMFGDIDSARDALDSLRQHGHRCSFFDEAQFYRVRLVNARLEREHAAGATTQEEGPKHHHPRSLAPTRRCSQCTKTSMMNWAA